MMTPNTYAAITNAAVQRAVKDLRGAFKRTEVYNLDAGKPVKPRPTTERTFTLLPGIHTGLVRPFLPDSTLQSERIEGAIYRACAACTSPLRVLRLVRRIDVITNWIYSVLSACDREWEARQRDPGVQRAIQALEAEAARAALENQYDRSVPHASGHAPGGVDPLPILGMPGTLSASTTITGGTGADLYIDDATLARSMAVLSGGVLETLLENAFEKAPAKNPKAP